VSPSELSGAILAVTACADGPPGKARTSLGAIGPALGALGLVFTLSGGSLSPGLTWFVWVVLILAIAVVAFGLWPGPRRPSKDR
jgi:hypothetical protein